MTHLVQVNPLLFEPADRMTLDDFLSRWDKMPGLKFAELIDGVVYMPSPVSYDHGRRDGQVQLLLGNYAVRTGVCEVIPNATWLMAGSAPQPDVALRLPPQFGGKTFQPVRRSSGHGCPCHRERKKTRAATVRIAGRYVVKRVTVLIPIAPFSTI